MKKILISALATLALVSCGSKTLQEENNGSSTFSLPSRFVCAAYWTTQGISYRVTVWGNSIDGIKVDPASVRMSLFMNNTQIFRAARPTQIEAGTNGFAYLSPDKMWVNAGMASYGRDSSMGVSVENRNLNPIKSTGGQAPCVANTL